MDSNLFHAQHVLSTGLNPTMENGFKFLKIRGEERMWILFSLSIVKVLNGFLLNRNPENLLPKINTHIVETIMFIFDDQ